MQLRRIAFALLLTMAALGGTLSLVSASLDDDRCPRRPGPPFLDCLNCPDVYDPVVCTVQCAGGTQQKTFSNRCFAGCTGYIFKGECTPVGP